MSDEMVSFSELLYRRTCSVVVYMLKHVYLTVQ